MIIQAEWHAPREAIQEEGNEYIGYVKNALSKQMAEGVMDILSREPSVAIIKQDLRSFDDYRTNAVCYLASLKWKPLVKCRECKHRPRPSFPGANVFKDAFPDDVCPYRDKEGCLDIWESKCPPDDFFCAYGEREDKDNAEIH